MPTACLYDYKPETETAIRPDPLTTETDCAALFAEFAPLIRRIVRQYGRTPDLKQEFQGELYYRFHVLLNRYDPTRGIPLRPYLVRQLTATAYSYARTHWQQRERETELVDGILPGSRGLLPDPTDEWDTTLQKRRVTAKLPVLIDRLPPRQRAVVKWRYVEQLSFEQIANLLDIQPSTARSLLRTGLSRLRELLDAERPS